jgi:hypothetical protein
MQILYKATKVFCTPFIGIDGYAIIKLDRLEKLIGTKY